MVRPGNLAVGVLLASGMIAMGLPARSQDSSALSISCQGPLSMPEVQEMLRKWRLIETILRYTHNSGTDSDQFFEHFKSNLNLYLDRCCQKPSKPSERLKS